MARILEIEGHVQGVFYRAFVSDAAERHGVAGFARNLPDGSVVVRLEGGADSVAEVERACSQGPSRARVDSVKAVDSEIEGFERFEVG